MTKLELALETLKDYMTHCDFPQHNGSFFEGYKDGIQFAIEILEITNKVEVGFAVKQL